MKNSYFSIDEFVAIWKQYIFVVSSPSFERHHLRITSCLTLRNKVLVNCDVIRPHGRVKHLIKSCKNLKLCFFAINKFL